MGTVDLSFILYVYAEVLQADTLVNEESGDTRSCAVGRNQQTALRHNVCYAVLWNFSIEKKFLYFYI